MPQRITIQFPADRDPFFYTRVWHLAEELYRAIDMRGMGVVHDVDQVRETLRIDVHKPQDLGEVMQILKRSLPRHFPGGEGEIVRGEPEGDA
jgi:hypothetical protein